jgi:hypothetical protein
MSFELETMLPRSKMKINDCEQTNRHAQFCRSLERNPDKMEFEIVAPVTRVDISKEPLNEVNSLVSSTLPQEQTCNRKGIPQVCRISQALAPLMDV